MKRISISSNMVKVSMFASLLDRKIKEMLKTNYANAEDVSWEITIKMRR